jgi:NAD(P)H-nitrite reductase large subunit
VIIGNSYAGIGAAEAIRKIDRRCEIIMISDEPYRAYARPLISYYIKGGIAAKDMYYRPSNFYRKNDITFLSGERVKGLNSADHEIYLGDKRVVKYDTLLISTGGKPFTPAIEGIGSRNVLGFTKWDEAKTIKRLAKTKKKGIVIGGGLIGVKAAEGMRALGLEVTIVIKGPRVLSLVLDETAGTIANRQLRKNGIKTITGLNVEEVLADKDGQVCGVTLENGKRLDCGIFIVAKGFRPNIDFVKNTPIHTNKGIDVDRYMMTNIENVYAAGDVAEAWDLLNENNSVIAIAPLACQQGRIAGSNMAGQRRFYPGGISMNSIQVSHLPVMTMGLTTREVRDIHEKAAFRKGKVYRKVIFHENKLVGATLVGDVGYGGVLTHLIRSQADMDDAGKRKLTGDGLRKGNFAPLLQKTVHDTARGSMGHKSSGFLKRVG